ncbi:hypothetical protein [Mycolicibacterium tokaiense]|uniref:hypothetical protein n=1 Tax=Mycolicibacterium tokaiense TaxID=39695 RepID=UPI0011C01D29|nr:hypothetical protein [Mycolicibacterium tokaiense]BBY84700.1 hypothetical protein MTOK_04820 [Mycolicibacterium tokaiense]
MAADVEGTTAPRCWECGGPCLTYRGSVHGWRCSTCIDRYLAAGAARADIKDRLARERLTRNHHAPAPSLRSG